MNDFNLKYEIIVHLKNQIEKKINKMALICGEKSWDYGFFLKEIQKARWFLRIKAKNLKLVVIKSPPTLEMIALFYACLFEDKTLVPISIFETEDRVNVILNSLGQYLIVDPVNDLEIEGIVGGTSVDNFDFDIRFDASDNNDVLCIHTSGTTGNPKGVLLNLKNLSAFFNGINNLVGFNKDEIFLNSHLPHFDMFYFSIWQFCLSEGCLVLPKSEIERVFFLDLVASQKVTTLFLVPPHILKLKNTQIETTKLKTLRNVLFAGDKLKSEEALFFKKLVPEVQVFNTYGPTETTIVCAGCRLNSEFDFKDPIAIGYPFEGTHFSLKNLVNVSSKTVDELVISGNQVAEKGYLSGDSPSFFKDNKSKNSYYSGDLAWQDESGRYFIEGRNDRQIKKNGIRIELKEIESWLLQKSFIASCCCLFDDLKQKIILIVFDFKTGYEIGVSSDDIDVLKVKKDINLVLPLHLKVDELHIDFEPRMTSNMKLDYKYLKTKYLNKL